MNNSDVEKKRLIELDVLRGVSALLIMLYHYTTRYFEINNVSFNWKITFPWGAGAVNVFFFLTAFLTIITLKEKTSALTYAKKRFIRLYPEYWICIIITSAACALLMPRLASDWKTIIVNFTMFQSFLGVQNVDGVYWTLGIELRFYFLIFTILLLGKIKWTELLCVLWFACGVLVYVLHSLFIDNSFISIIESLLSVKFVAPFTGGVIVGRIYKSKGTEIEQIAYGGIILATIIFSFITQTISYCSLYVASLVFIIGTITCKKRRYNKYLVVFKPILFIASISYPLFLLHQFIGYIIIEKISMYYHGEIIVLVPLSVSILLAWIVHAGWGELGFAIRAKVACKGRNEV